MSRYLIVNADDFGQSPGINRGICEAASRGIITSASLMVRWPAATDAVEAARQLPAVSVGLHIDLGEWRFGNGDWVPVYEVVPLDDEDRAHAEVAAQLQSFRRICGCDPTHIDSHQHVHVREPVAGIVRKMAAELGVPCRGDGRVAYHGGFYGQTERGDPLLDRVSVGALATILEGLGEGTTELGCHPADFSAGVDVAGMYLAEREAELRTLCDPRARQELERRGIQLCSFHDYHPRPIDE